MESRITFSTEFDSYKKSGIIAGYDKTANKQQLLDFPKRKAFLERMPNIERLESKLAKNNLKALFTVTDKGPFFAQVQPEGRVGMVAVMDTFENKSISEGLKALGKFFLHPIKGSRGMRLVENSNVFSKMEQLCETVPQSLVKVQASRIGKMIRTLIHK